MLFIIACSMRINQSTDHTANPLPPCWLFEFIINRFLSNGSLAFIFLVCFVMFCCCCCFVFGGVSFSYHRKSTNNPLFRKEIGTYAICVQMKVLVAQFSITIECKSIRSQYFPYLLSHKAQYVQHIPALVHNQFISPQSSHRNGQQTTFHTHNPCIVCTWTMPCERRPNTKQEQKREKSVTPMPISGSHFASQAHAYSAFKQARVLFHS